MATRVKRLETARRAALKELVRLAHGAAWTFEMPGPEGPPSADQVLICTQLRLLADLLDAVATRGARTKLDGYFEGPA